MAAEDFFSAYLHYTRDTEAGAMYHRWSAIGMVATLLGKNIKFPFGQFTIYPNMYLMLIGEPGARKTTAIKIAKKLAAEVGFKNFAPNKTSKEKFMQKLARGMGKTNEGIVADLLEQNLFGVQDDDRITECFICNDEFNNFIGISNIEFISLLGELWDYEGTYENELKNSESDYIPNPCINILGGNTHENFSTAFPPVVLGQGFFSRLLLIYGERTRPKITFPKLPDPAETAYIIQWLKRIREYNYGEISMTPAARGMIDTIYKKWKDLDDPRFISYSNRRFNHFLKLALVYCATRLSSELTEDDVLRANSVLSFTEAYMPKAMGEIGRSKRSEAAQKVMTIINAAPGPISFNDIWRHMTGDIEKVADMAILIQNLVVAGKLISLPDGSGFLPRRTVLVESPDGLIDYSFITEEEKGMKR